MFCPMIIGYSLPHGNIHQVIPDVDQNTPDFFQIRMPLIYKSVMAPNFDSTNKPTTQ